MKDFVVNKSIILVKKHYPTYDKTKIAEIKYGIEAIYATFSKLFIILAVSIVLKTFKETLTLIVLFNILRLTAFGLHASKSRICWITSSLIFIILPIIAKSVEIPNILNILISLLCVVSYILYAPADTKKRPLINRKRRKTYKILTTFTGIIYLILNIFLKDPYLINSITIAMIIETVMILPITYKIFNLSYNNYLNYKSC